MLLWKFYTNHITVSECNVTQQTCDSQPGVKEGASDSRGCTNSTNSEKKRASSEMEGKGESNISCSSGRVSSEESSGAGIADYSGLRPHGELLDGRSVTFRATCTRHGRKHSFTSQEAAKHFGAGLAQYFGWKVQLKNPDIEVLLDISGDSATVGIALTQTAKFKRNIAHFGPTTLRATIAYGMLRQV